MLDAARSVLVLALGLALFGCEKATYDVKGEGTATIAYWDGEMRTEKGVKLPWTKQVSVGSKLELEAEGQGQIECSITREGGAIVGEFGAGSCTASASR